MVVIVDYGMGNLRSVRNAVVHLGFDARVSGDPSDVLSAEKLILPGVGSFRRAMENIHARDLYKPLTTAVIQRQTPVLGICLGMQLLAGYGHEDGGATGLGWIPGEVVAFCFDDPAVRIPHVGFNNVYAATSPSRLIDTAAAANDFYFVHGYHFRCDDERDVTAWCDYHGQFVAGVERGNVFGTQFHPEKSQANGLRVLARFLRV